MTTCASEFGVRLAHLSFTIISGGINVVSGGLIDQSQVTVDGFLKLQFPRLTHKVLAEAVVRFLFYEFVAFSDIVLSCGCQ